MSMHPALGNVYVHQSYMCNNVCVISDVNFRLCMYSYAGNNIQHLFVVVQLNVIFEWYDLQLK